MFRFEDLEVWQKSADLAFALVEVAEQLSNRHIYRFAEQLRSSALSISSNIAEGSSSNSNNEFRTLLNYARRSAFECANMLVLFRRSNIVAEAQSRRQREELSRVCRMITALSRSLG